MGKTARVPVILQMEVCECGAASLGMVLAYYGRRLSLEQLRVECGVTSNGSNMTMLKAAAQRNGLTARVYKMDIESVQGVKTPAILHWQMAHFVVLCGFNKKGAVIADPACGRIHVGCEAFSDAFTGIVMTFEKSEEFAQETKVKDQSFISAHIKRFIPALSVALSAGVIAAGAQFFIPLFDTAFIDRVLIEGNRGELPVLLILLSACAILAASASALGAKVQDFIERRMALGINMDFMYRLCSLPISFFMQRNPGELTDRQNGNLEIAGSVCRMAETLVVNTFISMCYLIGFWVFDAWIGLIGLFAALANTGMIFVFSKRLEQSSILYRRNMGVLRSSVTSAVDMAETIKACGCEDVIFERLTGAGAKNYGICSSMERLSNMSGVFFTLTNQLVNALLLIYGITQVISGNFTVGLVVALEGLMAAFLAPLGVSARTGVNMRTLHGSAEAANDAMNYGKETSFSEESEQQTDEIHGDIVAEGVSFRYGIYDSPVLSEISFTLEKGKSIAFAGGSGCGKSTMAKLLAGLYTPSKGKLYYSGQEIYSFTKEYFYEKVAIVDQHISLFSGTVLDNITLFDDRLSYEDAVEAAKLACIHDEILLRKDGYLSAVEEQGKNFSGGQRQRIEIARALAKKPSILILDEATSALDAEAEEQIMENIRKQNITLIIVAHRLSTIRDCDEIAVMQDGKICERGTHHALMEQKGVYSALVEGGNV